ncbi:protein-glutamate O-methyltransferase CheR [Alloacidobacterium dinghuense]|uniref:Protein-glutamate O-methyltransferase CheR n=1 Tax=Alloacidobacterium dinghuense TaxID=2763107 RepID=A0A7G8BL74_9BACT|nr:protein-glutamate O-methyltransferase CheR [Alloacidobacterium dinghuense]QNI33294.1 protein-glutamate O-methyltransferase CheR [Alloacidobacterium dinghuense]
MPSTETDYSFLRKFIQSRSENILDPSRNDIFDARLYRLLQVHGMSGIDDLVRRLRLAADPMLDQAVVEAMTINETSFFRDQAPFELLRNELLPRLIERRGLQRSLRFWSAACSSGQEAYSLAMLIRYHFPQIAEWKIEIVGTDIHADMIRRAQSGRYQRMEINRGLPARLLLKYFTRDDDEWEVTPELRSLCHFQQRNLSHTLPALDVYDGILMRNVLFYFSDATRKRVLQNVHVALQSDGFLILGSSEQPAQLDLWQPALDDKTCYYSPR